MATRFLSLVALTATLFLGHGTNSAFAQAASEFAPLPARPTKPKPVQPAPPTPPKVEAPVTPPPAIAAEPKPAAPAEPTPPATPAVTPPSVPAPATPKTEEAHKHKATPAEAAAEKKAQEKKKAEEKKAEEKKRAEEKKFEQKKKAEETRAEEKRKRAEEKEKEKKKKEEAKAPPEPKPEKVELKNEARLPADDHGPRAIDFISKCLDNYDKCIAYVRELGEKIPASDVCMQNASDQAEITEKVRKFITLRPAIYQQAANRMVTEALYVIYPCKRSAGKKK
jgi:hypothetical protein